MINAAEFDKLISSVNEISTLFQDGVVFIGGIAVYLHAINHNETAGMAEFTHDADLYISLADMADLRDIEEVTPNRRLSKHQFIKNGFDFDVYTERQSSLIIPYDEVMGNSVQYNSVRVAGLEHLFTLKLEAYRDRCQSAKGQKDAKDIIRIVRIASTGSFDHSLVAGCLGDEHVELLKRIERGPEFMNLAKGNAMTAKSLRREFSSFILDNAQAALPNQNQN